MVPVEDLTLIKKLNLGPLTYVTLVSVEDLMQVQAKILTTDAFEKKKRSHPGFCWQFIEDLLKILLSLLLWFLL